MKVKGKKLRSLLLALSMCLILVSPAWAAETDPADTETAESSAVEQEETLEALTTAKNGIYGNGTSGISININTTPYTTYANKSYGQYAYTTSGCAWFASARVCQLTGKSTEIYAGSTWYNTRYKTYGFSRGSTVKAKALACYKNHVSVVEAVNGSTVTISEGGVNSSTYKNYGYCRITTMSVSKLESARGGAFLGYVYLATTSTSAISSWTGTYATPTTNDAKIYTKAVASASGSFTQAGVTIWENGTKVASKTENVSYTRSNLEVWYNIQSELGYTLSPSTTYSYQFFVVYNGTKYTSPTYSFTTKTATVSSGTCGSSVKWSLDSTGKLTISGSGAMTNYASQSAQPWYSYSSSIKTVSIGSGVTSIGSYAFCKTSLTSVSIPSTVTSIGNCAFWSCTSLSSITIPSGVKSIGVSAFDTCSGLKSVTIPSSVTSIGGWAFSSCYYLTSVSLPNTITALNNGTFYYCNRLTSITIPGSVESIGEKTFYNCESLTSVTIGSGITSIGASAFDGCTGLTSVTIPSSVKSIGEYAFSGCADSLIISGYINSTAQTYAENNDITFKPLDSLSTPKLSSVSNSAKGITVKWGAVSGAAKYRVYYKTSGGSWTTLTDTTSTSYTWTKAASGTVYTFTVRCVSSGGKIATSGFDAMGKSIKYLTAGTISSLTNTSKGVKVQWKKVTGATGYYVYRKTGSGKYAKLTTIKKNATVSYSDTAVKSKNGKTYTYAVVPCSGSYKGAYTGSSIVRLSGVSVKSASNVKGKKLKVSWKKDSKAAGYQIQYSTNKKFSAATTVKVKKNSTTSTTISKLTKNKKYYVRIRTYKTVDATKYYSAWSTYGSTVKIKK